jgi:hypothetical protein
MSAKNTAPDDDCPGTERTISQGEGDEHLGAVEGDRPSDCPQQGNRNAPALDGEGMPNDSTAVAEDVIGANEDETEG